MKTVSIKMVLGVMLMYTLAFLSPVMLSAASLDDIQASDESSIVQPEPTQPVVTDDSDSSALADYMRGYNPITESNMAVASKTMSPFVSACGNLMGCIMIATSALIFVVTACDLLYIGVPFTRGLLAPRNQALAQQGGMMQGGYGGYRGGYGGYGGGYGGGMMQQQQAQPQGHQFRIVSDEAFACVMQFSDMGAQQQQMQGSMGMGMGGMMQQPQQQPMNAPFKLVIWEYFKRRFLFVILFAICSVVLMSSALTNCGINIAELGLKALNKLSNQAATAQI